MNLFKRTRRAVSLLEPVIVIAVLAIASAVFFPLATHLMHKSRIDIIETQLTGMSNSARTYLVKTSLRRVSYNALVRGNVIKPAESVLGETYDHIVFDHKGGKISVTTPDEERITINY